MESADKKYELNKELEDISPGLANLLKKSSSTDVPFRYFDKLPDQIIARINNYSRTTFSWIDYVISFWNKRPSLVLAIASVIGALILTVVLFSKSPVLEMDLAKVNSTEVESYLLKHAAELDDDQLSLLQNTDSKMDLMDITEEELAPVMDEYLYQINEDELN